MKRKTVLGLIDLFVSLFGVLFYAGLLFFAHKGLSNNEFEIFSLSIGGFGLGLVFCSLVFNLALAFKNKTYKTSSFFIGISIAYIMVATLSPESFRFMENFFNLKTPGHLQQFFMFLGYYVLLAFFLIRLPAGRRKYIVITVSFVAFVIMFFTINGTWRLISLLAPTALVYLLFRGLEHPFNTHAKLYYLISLLVIGEAFTFSLFSIVFNDFEAVIGLQSIVVAGLALILSFYGADLLLEMKGKGDASSRQQEIYLKARAENLAGQSMPHFLFNSLTFVKASFHSSQEEGMKALTLLEKNIENFITTDETELVPFTEEIDFIKDYIELTSLRKGYKVKVHYNLEATDFSVPPLSLQIFIENSVRYGGLEKREDGALWISTKKLITSIKITIRDNGDGFDPKEVSGPLHTGSNNAKYRLEYLLNASVEIASSPGKGTVVTVVIPY